MGLAEYKRKRDFKKTAEPAGSKPLPRKVKGASRFVIQKHAARRLHYDFRLEMEGVLKSWALPKGLPLKRGEKHLAVEEAHRLIACVRDVTESLLDSRDRRVRVGRHLYRNVSRLA